MSVPTPPSEQNSPAATRRSRRLAGFTRVLRWAAPRYSFVEEEVLGLRGVVKPGDVCFDIGAEYGLYTYPLAELVGARGQVHSFEPLPGPMRVLSAGVGLLGCRNVRRYPMALSHEAGRGELSLPRRRGLPVHGRAYLTTGARDQGPNAEFATSVPIHVEVSSLDDICARQGIQRVDFVKADVEGAEPAVIEGAEEILAAHRPTLLLEIEDRHLAKYGKSAADLVSLLAGHGYRMHHWRDGGWRHVAKVTTERRNYLFTADARAE
jgi:FkbM family methyltransferase